MERFQLELIFFFPLFSTIVPSNSCMFPSGRPFVVNTTFSTGLMGPEVTSVPWLGPNNTHSDKIISDMLKIREFAKE